MHGEARTDGGADGHQSLLSRATALDLALLVSVPLVLLAVASLPLRTRLAFGFEYASPSLATAVASSFVHLDRGHLIANLAGYVLVVPTAYLLSVTSGHRRRFRVVFVALLLVTPVALPYLNLTIVRRSVTVGFSGVLTALYGFLPVALATYLQRRLAVGSRRQTAPLLFFVGVVVVIVLTLRAVVTHPVAVPVRGVVVPVRPVLTATLVGLVAAIVLIVVLYWLSIDADAQTLAASIRSALGRPGQFELLVIGVAVFLVFPVAAFPVDPDAGGVVSNLYAHFVGYALGFTGTYATLEVHRAVFDTPL